MGAPSPTRPDPEDAARIARVCGPCDQFQPASGWCMAAVASYAAFLRIFDDGRRCRPRDFLVRFLRGYLSRGYRESRRDRAEDFAHRVIVDLLEAPPKEVPTPDLGGLRRFLAARAIQAVVDELREKEGRLRCGNCRYHQKLPGGLRRCHHPSPDHPWSGKEVRASEDPRRFDPPCETFASARSESAIETDDSFPVPSPADPDEGLVQDEKRRALLEALIALQREDARVAYAVYLSYIKGQENHDIARELRASVKTVIRYKQKGLALLRPELERRGILGI